MEYTLEPERKPAVNPFASDQVVRTKPKLITTLIQYLDKEPDVCINAPYRNQQH